VTDGARRLFHVLSRTDWERFLEDGAPVLRPASLAREGYAHLSFAPQLAGTLALHFAGAGALVLLEVVPAADGALVLEPSREGALFPHLRRPLAREEIRAAWPVPLGPDGPVLPHLGADAADDEPPGAWEGAGDR
jgi:uncharacterized protein (DUF952 family)